MKKYRAPQSTLSQIEPTFEEFVRYLVDTDLSLYADDHWIPYYLFCTPCLVNYDVIIHFESMQEDVQLLLDRLGDHSGPEWKHRSSGSKSGSHLMKSFYGQVSRSTLKKLYDKYRLDFELFDYLPDDYLAVSRPDDTSWRRGTLITLNGANQRGLVRYFIVWLQPVNTKRSASRDSTRKRGKTRNQTSEILTYEQSRCRHHQRSVDQPHHIWKRCTYCRDVKACRSVWELGTDLRVMGRKDAAGGA